MPLLACWSRIWRVFGRVTIIVLLPVSALLGALFMLLADMLARALAWPGELPAGAVLALAGGPCFVWLVRRRG